MTGSGQTAAARELSSLEFVSGESATAVETAVETEAERRGAEPDASGIAAIERGAAPGEHQLVHLDRECASDVPCDDPVTIDGIDVPAFSAPEDVAGEETGIVDAMLADLGGRFASTGVVFTLSDPAGEMKG